MNGITILYTYTYSPSEFGKIIAFLFCLFMFIAFTILAIGLLIDGEKKHSLSSSIIALISLIACIFIFSVKTNSYERYEVIIDDSINFSEFSEKYEIIEVRGEIYTIEERVD